MSTFEKIRDIFRQEEANPGLWRNPLQAIANWHDVELADCTQLDAEKPKHFSIAKSEERISDELERISLFMDSLQHSEHRRFLSLHIGINYPPELDWKVTSGALHISEDMFRETFKHYDTVEHDEVYDRLTVQFLSLRVFALTVKTQEDER